MSRLERAAGRNTKTKDTGSLQGDESRFSKRGSPDKKPDDFIPREQRDINKIREEGGVFIDVAEAGEIGIPTSEL